MSAWIMPSLIPRKDPPLDVLGCRCGCDDNPAPVVSMACGSDCCAGRRGLFVFGTDPIGLIALIDFPGKRHGPSQAVAGKKRKYFTVEEANKACRWSG